ncbi:hypothetical protein AB0929_31490 [Streptomyces massasporeus]|uniref:hypothetical protein n=1 Tax=Streptomyces massasporeus TaxID=67324 RepID=UPI0034523D6A
MIGKLLPRWHLPWATAFETTVDKSLALLIHVTRRHEPLHQHFLKFAHLWREAWWLLTPPKVEFAREAAIRPQTGVYGTETSLGKYVFPEQYFRSHPMVSASRYEDLRQQFFRSFVIRGMGLRFTIPGVSLALLPFGRKHRAIWRLKIALAATAVAVYIVFTPLWLLRWVEIYQGQLAGAYIDAEIAGDPDELERLARNIHQVALDAVHDSSVSGKPLVVYLRDFDLEFETTSDGFEINLAGARLEEELVKKLSGAVVVTVANPWDLLAVPGSGASPFRPDSADAGVRAFRIFAGADNWRSVVRDLVIRASAIVVAMGDCSPGVIWEVELCKEVGAAGKTVLILPQGFTVVKNSQPEENGSTPDYYRIQLHWGRRNNGARVTKQVARTLKAFRRVASTEDAAREILRLLGK